LIAAHVIFPVVKILSRETKNLRIMTLSSVKESIWVMLLASSLYTPLRDIDRAPFPTSEIVGYL